MKLDVLPTDTQQPWYDKGLKFTCSQCGNCCTGGPGYVWLSEQEITRLAEHLEMNAEAVVEKYCRKIDGKFSLKEKRGPGGLYDCIFLQEEKVAQPGSTGETIVLTRRRCSVYAVRPLQCRTWPFWSENLASKKRWNHAARRCHGMNAGSRTFTPRQIESIRDAADWPANPPTSRIDR